jgi:hypothetical protein
MKQFYIVPIKLVFKPNWGGGRPQPVGRFFIIHTFAMESPSFSSHLIHEKRKEKGTFLDTYVNT